MKKEVEEFRKKMGDKGDKDNRDKRRDGKDKRLDVSESHDFSVIQNRNDVLHVLETLQYCKDEPVSDGIHVPLALATKEGTAESVMTSRNFHILADFRVRGGLTAASVHSMDVPAGSSADTTTITTTASYPHVRWTLYGNRAEKLTFQVESVPAYVFCIR